MDSAASKWTNIFSHQSPLHHDMIDQEFENNIYLDNPYANDVRMDSPILMPIENQDRDINFDTNLQGNLMESEDINYTETTDMNSRNDMQIDNNLNEPSLSNILFFKNDLNASVKTSTYGSYHYSTTKKGTHTSTGYTNDDYIIYDQNNTIPQIYPMSNNNDPNNNDDTSNGDINNSISASKNKRRSETNQNEVYNFQNLIIKIIKEDLSKISLLNDKEIHLINSILDEIKSVVKSKRDPRKKEKVTDNRFNTSYFVIIEFLLFPSSDQTKSDLRILREGISLEKSNYIREILYNHIRNILKSDDLLERYRLKCGVGKKTKKSKKMESNDNAIAQKKFEYMLVHQGSKIIAPLEVSLRKKDKEIYYIDENWRNKVCAHAQDKNYNSDMFKK